jgi:hypothetical protein
MEPLRPLLLLAEHPCFAMGLKNITMHVACVNIKMHIDIKPDSYQTCPFSPLSPPSRRTAFSPVS